MSLQQMPNHSPFVLRPWLFVLWCMAGWASEQQRQVIEYLTTENAVLCEKLGGRRIMLRDDQRRRLIFFGKSALDHGTDQFLVHYHIERPHQGLNNELIIKFEHPLDSVSRSPLREHLNLAREI